MEQTMKKYTNQYTNYENTNYEKIKVNSSFGISKTLYDNDSYYYNYLERVLQSFEISCEEFLLI